MNAIAGTMDEAHYMCSRSDYEPLSTRADLREFLGGLEIKNLRNNYVSARLIFEIRRSKGETVGQAFMNAIPEEMYDRLSGTLLDPFYKIDERDTLIALDYLLFSK